MQNGELYKLVQSVIAKAKRTTVLPMLHYGRATITEATIDKSFSSSANSTPTTWRGCVRTIRKLLRRKQSNSERN